MKKELTVISLVITVFFAFSNQAFVGTDEKDQAENAQINLEKSWVAMHITGDPLSDEMLLNAQELDLDRDQLIHNILGEHKNAGYQQMRTTCLSHSPQIINLVLTKDFILIYQSAAIIVKGFLEKPNDPVHPHLAYEGLYDACFNSFLAAGESLLGNSEIQLSLYNAAYEATTLGAIKQILLFYKHGTEFDFEKLLKQ
jgi:hypothetical protein